MIIVTVYPRESVKLAHRKAGQVISLCPNDGTVDNNVYMVCASMNEGSSNDRLLVNLYTGVAIRRSVSARTVVHDKAVLHLGGIEES